ncbi:DUF262 domain-containing protein [Jiangella aurantiaca]|uniref:DUF262 domain-containing protein n=1 Tax=Jiangella aurantiaca TaxID=2530373 RepID=UPI0013A5C128|nr:DUF262 domain-containing protein [Jiangella aurantiaca]
MNTLIEQWHDKTLTLPEIQRQYVWDRARASRLIESLLLNIPIPVVYFSETQDVNYLIIDGHQRIQSIVNYVENQFALSGLKVLSGLNGLRFGALSPRDQRQIRTRVIRAIIISVDSDPMMKFEVFERLNTGSIALNAQEIRNSTHRGPMNELIKKFALSPDFRTCVGTARPRPRMVDNELILRFLALESSWQSYKPPLKKYLNNYMDKANGWPESQLSEAEARFDRSVAGLVEVLGQAAFRLTDDTGVPIDRALNRALAETQLVSFSWIRNTDLDSTRSDILRALGALYGNSVFLDSIQRATGDRRRTLRRLGMFCSALTEAGVTLSQQVSFESVE